MKDKEAIAIVLRSAEAHAGGHEHCHRIHEAVAKVREILDLIERRPKSPPRQLDVNEMLEP